MFKHSLGTSTAGSEAIGRVVLASAVGTDMQAWLVIKLN